MGRVTCMICFWWFPVAVAVVVETTVNKCLEGLGDKQKQPPTEDDDRVPCVWRQHQSNPNEREREVLKKASHSGTDTIDANCKQKKGEVPLVIWLTKLCDPLFLKQIQEVQTEFEKVEIEKKE